MGRGHPSSNSASSNRTISSALNTTGSFQFRATRVGKETALAQIIRLVQQAQGSRAPVQRLVDRVAAVFVPTVIVIALLTFLAWYFVGGVGFTQALIFAVAVLVTRTRLQLSQKLWVRGVMKPSRPPVSSTLT